METYISLVGIVIAFCTLIFLMMRGVNLFITVMIASLIAIVSGNMNIYKTLTENYMTGFADYYRSYYLVFFCGTLLGTYIHEPCSMGYSTPSITKKPSPLNITHQCGQLCWC